MEIRKSGKLAIGIIAAMGTIGALHWFVFKDRAAAYMRANEEYNRVSQDYNTQGNPPQLNDIYKFRYETLRYKIEFWETIAKLDVTLPDYHMPDATGTFNTPLLQQKLWDVYGELKKRKAEGEADNGPRLSFLGRRGWNFADTLPEELATNQIATEDLLTNLSNEKRLIDSLDPNSPVYQARQANYNNMLARLGLNINERAFLADRYGDLFSTLFTINRIDNVMSDLPADYFRNANVRLTEQQALDTMYELFQLEWPRDFTDNVAYLFAQRQGEATLTLIDMAKEEGITDIVRVKYYDFMPIYWEEPKSEEEEEATPAVDEMGMFGFDEFMMMGGGEEGMMGGFGGRFGGGAMMMRATPTPEQAFDSVGVPIEIWVQGSNSAVMSFFYRVTHTEHPFELDRIRLFTLPDQEGVVIGTGFINVVTFAQAVGIMTETDLERKLVETRIELYEVAQRPGAGELAERDGLVEREGNTYRLIVPMPTPWGGQQSTPAPPPPMDMDGNPEGLPPGF